MARRDDGPYKKGAKVIATEDLRGVPEGSRGKVGLINGLTWTRYWVFFENGVSLGSLDGSKLVAADGWEQYKIDRVKAAETAAIDAEAAEKAEAEAKAKAADEKPAEAKSQIPAHLLERAKKAKEKKAAAGG